MNKKNLLNRGFEPGVRDALHLRSNGGVSGDLAPLKRWAVAFCKLGVVALYVKTGAMAQSLARPQAALPSPQITSHSSGRGISWWPAKPGWLGVRAA